LIDGSGRMGRGVAYSTTESVHLLNVRAESMSAIAGKPADFVKRFEAEGGDPRGFAQRRFFGRYLDEILDRAVSGGCVQPVAALADRAERANGAWTITRGTKGPQAAGVIHTDFEKGFIRAETIAYEDYVSLGGEVGAKDAGKMRLEGKEYVVKDGDVMHFRFAN